MREGTYRILCVDDSLTTRAAMKAVLELAGFEVIPAGDGEEALGILERTPVGLVVTDVQMPRLDGLGLIRRIRGDARLRSLPTILVTSLDGADGSVPDGRLDGPLFLRLAPLHGGLEGNPYLVVALAVDLDRLEGRGACTDLDRSGCTALSGLVFQGEALPYGETVSFDAAFLGFPEGASFQLPGRTFFATGGVTGAQVGRLAFRDDEGGEWHVWLSGTTTVTLPLPPAGLDDRVLDADGSRASLFAQSLLLDASFEAVVGYGAVHTGNLAAFTRAFSSSTVPR